MSRRLCYISPLAVIGEPAECRADEPDAGWYIAPSATIEALATIDSGTHKMTRIDADAWVFKHAHIGHDAHIMEGAEISTRATIGGHCIVGPHARIGLSATLLPWIVIGRRARVGAGSVVTHDVPPGETWAGNPARRLTKRVDTSTLPDTNTPSSNPTSPTSATDAAAEAWEYLASQGTPKKSGTPGQVAA